MPPITFVHTGPIDDLKIPNQNLAALFFNKHKQLDQNLAVIDSYTQEQFTFTEIFEISQHVANSFKELGVKPGDVITISSENSWKLLVSVLGALYIGAKVNLLNPDYSLGELNELVPICKPVLVLCSQKSVQQFLDLKAQNLLSARIYLLNYDASIEVEDFSTLVENTKGLDEPVALDLQDVAVIVTSSGTTGFPKLVQLTHENIRNALVFGGSPVQCDVNLNEILLIHIPFFHIFGFLTTLIGLYHKSKIVLMEKFDPARFLENIQNHKVSKLLTVPQIVLFLVKSPLVDNYDCSSLKDLICGAAVLKKELIESLKKKFNLSSIRQIYGCSEITGGACVTPKGQTKILSVGKPVTGLKVKICDTETKLALPAFARGEILIGGVGLMKGYMCNHAESVDALDEDNFFRTGDLGYYDDEGFFYVIDRLKEIIKCKGFQVSPAELENLILQIPDVKDCGIVGRPDERAGEVPIAFIVKQADSQVTSEEIMKYVKDNISIQKHIYDVKFINEIPRNSAGKILRAKLKEIAENN